VSAALSTDAADTLSMEVSVLEALAIVDAVI